MTGLVCFQVEGVEPDGVTGTLWERGRVIARSVAPTASTRLSLAYFNTEEEVDRVVGLVEGITREGAMEVEGTDWFRVMRGPAEEV